MAAAKFVDALNEQIAYEFAASQQYIANAVYYDGQTLPRLAAFFYALWAVASWRISRRAYGAWRILGIASAWVVMEWLRSVGTLSCSL